MDKIIVELEKKVEKLTIENEKLKNFVTKTKGSQKSFKNRAKGQGEWLKKEYPHVFKEQKHLDGGVKTDSVYKEDCLERVYWHYGYKVALGDVLGSLPKRVV